MPSTVVPGTNPPLVLGPATVIGSSGIVEFQGACSQVTVYIVGAGTISAGVLTLEEAFYPITAGGGTPYTGTWVPIGSTFDITTLSGGKQGVVHIANSIWALRVRISTGVTGAGGTVTVYAYGN